MRGGVLAGYPMVDVKVTLLDGSFHEVDSSEMAFKIAASMAFKEACAKAQPRLLEPIMDVEVVVPEEYMGDVIGDLSARRGRIGGMFTRSEARVDRGVGARWRRCSDTRRGCARSPRGAPCTPCSSPATSTLPRVDGGRDHREGERLAARVATRLR